MGLLDAMNDPKMAMAMGLLGASGPSRMPVGIGQAMGQGYQAFQQAQDLNQGRELNQMKLGMLKDQIEAQKARKAQLEAFRSQLPPEMQSLFDVSPESVLKLFEPQKPEHKVVGNSLVQIGSNGVKPVFTAPEKQEKTQLEKTLDAAGITDPAERQKFIMQGLQKSVTHAPAASATVKLPPMETAENKAVGEDLAKQYTTIQNAGFKAQSTINNLKRMEQLMSGVGTGKLAGVTKELASLSESIGIKIDPKLGDKEAIEALSNEMALLARGDRMPGAMSDADRTFLQSIVPGLTKTPDGNSLIIETMKRLAKRDQQIAKMAVAYRNKNGTLNGFNQELQSWSEQNPLFSDINVGGGRSASGKIGGKNILNQADAIVGIGG